MHKPLIIGHRGASAVAPENTLAAFRKALEVGADGIEFDVQLSRDSVPVIIHDESLRRTGQRAEYVSALSADELERVNVGKWFDSRSAADDYSNETVPTLLQLLDLVSQGTSLLYLELKCRSNQMTDIVSITCDLLGGYSMRDRVIVECFDLELIREVKRVAPHLKTAALFQTSVRRPHLRSNAHGLVDEALAVGADEIALNYRLADDRTIECAHRAGLKVVVWTVDDPKWLTLAKKLGIHALITNDPGKMME